MKPNQIFLSRPYKEKKFPIPRKWLEESFFTFPSSEQNFEFNLKLKTKIKSASLVFSHCLVHFTGGETDDRADHEAITATTISNDRWKNCCRATRVEKTSLQTWDHQRTSFPPLCDTMHNTPPEGFLRGAPSAEVEDGVRFAMGSWGVLPNRRVPEINVIRYQKKNLMPYFYLFLLCYLCKKNYPSLK